MARDDTPEPAGAWAHAVRLATNTQASRNRAVDFLRAASISVVVLGHWMMAAPWVDADGYHIDSMLSVAPSSQFVSWVLQVMPVFFFVGGYSNGVSWDAARRDDLGYTHWLSGRLQRLLRPMLLLVAFWIVLGGVALALDVPAEMVRVSSQVALVPTWFLAVYLIPVMLVPLTRSLWMRYGMGTFWMLVVLAALNDLAFFAGDLRWLGWANYPLVWIAVHQLGYAWRAGYFQSRGMRVIWCLGGLALVVALVELGPWPRSLVGVPGESLSNTTPPKIPLLALAAFQIGAVTLLEPTLNRWLARLGPWTATVLVNASIMTIYLWHSTVMMLAFGAGAALGGVGLHAEPGSGAWWLARIAWLALFCIGLLPFIALLARFERGAATERTWIAWRLIAGALLTCGGLALLALGGINSTSPPALRVVPLLLPFVGVELAGFGLLALLSRRLARDTTPRR